MRRTIEVEIDDADGIHPVEPIAKLPSGRALLSWEISGDLETALLSERSLAADWLRPEEDEAWAYMQLDEQPSDQDIEGSPDEENPEWTKADFATSVPLSQLPTALQRKLTVCLGVTPSSSARNPAFEVRKYVDSVPEIDYKFTHFLSLRHLLGFFDIHVA